MEKNRQRASTENHFAVTLFACRAIVHSRKMVVICTFLEFVVNKIASAQITPLSSLMFHIIILLDSCSHQLILFPDVIGDLINILQKFFYASWSDGNLVFFMQNTSWNTAYY